MTHLVATSLTKSYRSRCVVADVSMEVSEGEVVGLLGPNGAGKTTAFYMIVGLIPCDRGRIMLDDTDLTGLPLHKRAQLGLGYLPQEASIFRKLTVEQNISAILELRADLDRASRESELEELLEDLHIAPVRNSLGISLSGGERRRVEIARALAARPRFILLDEPFAGVDPHTVEELQEEVRKLANNGIAVLVTDHNVQQTLRLCDRAYIIKDGEVIRHGTPSEIAADPRVREIYLGENFQLE